MNNDDTNPQPNKPQAPPASAFGPDKKVFDVMRPGKAPASPTSRPVVIGHKPQVHDDQLVPSADTRYASNNPLDEKRDLLTHKGGVDFASPGAADEYPDDPPGDNKPAPADALALGTQKELAAMGALASQIDKGEEQASADTTADVSSEDTDIASPNEMDSARATEPPESSTPTGSAEEASAPDAAGTEDAELLDESVDAAAPQPPVARTGQSSPYEPTPEESVPQERPSSQPTDQPAWPEEKQASTPPAEADISAGLPATEADVDQLPQLGPDDVIAATGAPVIDHSFIVHHKTRTKWWEWLLIILLILILAAVTLNFLLDAQIIRTNLDIPHTHLIRG